MNLLQLKKNLLYAEMDYLAYPYDYDAPHEVKIHASSLETAIQIAEVELKTDRSEFQYEIIQKGYFDFFNFYRKPYIVHFYFTPETNQNYNAYKVANYGIYYFDKQYRLRVYIDGIFLTIFPAENKKFKITSNFILNRLRVLKISSFDKALVSQVVFEARQKPVKIGEWKAQKGAQDSQVSVFISSDEMVASIYLHPPFSGGRHLKLKNILVALKKSGVKYGVDKDKINVALNNSIYYEHVSVAFGYNPLDEKQQIYIDYKVNLKKKVQYKEDEQGRVDFWNKSLIENVKKGQLLAEIVKQTQNEYQIFVTGRRLPVTIKKDELRPIILFGDGTYLSPNKTQLFAEKDGMVTFRKGKIYIEDVYNIYGDLGVNTGNIKFNGTVIVHGTVMDRLNIDVTGCVEVKDSIQRVNVLAHENIIVHKGVYGQNKALIESKKDSVYSRFIQDALVVAHNDVVVQDTIIRSKIFAGNTIECIEGKRAKVIGGQLVAGKSITVKSLGSTRNSNLLVIVGINAYDFFLLEKLNTIEKKIKLKNEYLEKNILTLKTNQKKGGTLSPEKQSLLNNMIKVKEALSKKLENILVEKKKLEEEVYSNSEDGAIHVYGKAYAGITIQIHKERFVFKKNYTHITIKLVDGKFAITDYDAPSLPISFKPLLSN